jgi:hypothetical protein
MAQPVAVRGLVMLAERKGTPVGFVSAENGDDPSHGILLDCLDVLAPHQGCGAGKLMIDAVRRWTKERSWLHRHNARDRPSVPYRRIDTSYVKRRLIGAMASR